MSSEQEPVVSPEATPGRRRIIVAPKLADKPKPLALIVRDPELQEEFEEQLDKARPVVVFPSLTHFCSDSLPTNWGGVVVARPCGFDARLMSFVPNTTCIAFWRVAEEGYGWPNDISHLRDASELQHWLGEIAKPQTVVPLKRVVREKRIVTRSKPSAREASKTPFKFELAVARGTVTSNAAPADTAGQMELGLDKKARQQIELPIAAPAKSESIKPAAQAARKSTPPKATSSAQKRVAKRAEQLAFNAGGAMSPGASAQQKRDQRAEKQASARRGAVTREIIAASAASAPRAEQAFVKLAAELGLLRAQELVAQLHAHAASLR